MTGPNDDIIKVKIDKRKKRVHRKSGQVKPYDIIVGILAIASGFGAIGLVYLIALTNLDGAFGWGALFMGLACFDLLKKVGTDPRPEEPNGVSVKKEYR